MKKRAVADNILLRVEKPGRYIGNEYNIVRKNIDDIDIRIAFCFPDVYEIGMSHLGMQILYHFFNRREDTYCERCFAPWVDLEGYMKEYNIPLFTLESQDELKKFDIVAFTLMYELSYTNILNMLSLAGIPIKSKDRKEDDPVIYAGGPCAYNPEPLADFVDFFYMGEGEVALDEVLDRYKSCDSKEEFLKSILDIEGIYVPKYYDVTYNEDGTIEKFLPSIDEAKGVINKVVVRDLDSSYYFDKPLVPLIQTVHDRVTLEIFRGCIRGCRFCHAGMVYRPVRQKKASTLIEHGKKLIKNTGYDEISLVSLSTSDYTELGELTNGLVDSMEGLNVNISLPSLRIDEFSINLLDKVKKVRKGGLTFAPEAGTQRLRDVINKGITEEDIMNGCKIAFEGGYDRIKLYFMIGLPTETEEDIYGISTLCKKILDLFYSIDRSKRSNRIKIIASVGCYVPKGFTPFQWDVQNTVEEFIEKQVMLKKSNNKRAIELHFSDPKTAIIEGILTRGDRRVGEALYKAYEEGFKFDAWTEYFDYNKWMDVFKQCNIDTDFYTKRLRAYDESFPWDFISVGVDKKFLMDEREKALREELTPNCREKCSNCGVARYKGGVCIDSKN